MNTPRTKAQNEPLDISGKIGNIDSGKEWPMYSYERPAYSRPYCEEYRKPPQWVDLEAENQRLRQALEAIRASNQRLREALVELVAEQDARDIPQGSSGYPDTGGLILARAALGDK